MKQSLKFKRTTIIAFGLLAFLVGLLSAYHFSWRTEPAVALFVLLLLSIFRKRSFTTLVMTVILGLFLGVWRGSSISSEVAHYKQFHSQEVAAVGRVLDDPVYDDKGRLDFRIGSVEVEGRSVPGQVRIKTRSNGVRRGDDVLATGKLAEGFGNYQASMYFADIQITGRSNNPIELLRRKFFAAVYSVLPEPQASLGLGFLVGLRSALPEDLDDQLRVAGLTHIVVASGYNLTVLVRLCRRLLARYSKYQAFIGSLALIVSFVMITGASPSMVRASVVTVLSLLAWYYGRRFQPMVIILLGAALTAGFNPLFIWSDVGWWLSFLAFGGVLVIAPLIGAKFWHKERPPLLMQVALETSSAQLMATPLILFVFGKVSLVALLANIAVVPFIPFAMAGTFVAGITSMLIPGTLGAILGAPANMLLTYIVSVTRFFSSFSWAQKNAGLSLAGITASYVAILLLVAFLYRKSRLRFNELPSVVE